MQDRIESVEALWAHFATPIRTAEDYINSLRGRRMNVFFMGERVPEPVDHPVIRPSINAMAETYRLATEQPDLASVHSAISNRRINRFLHVPVSAGELVDKHEMQRELGRRSGTRAAAPRPASSVAAALMPWAPVTRSPSISMPSTVAHSTSASILF